ncbi:SurA N-terminal domain-containing protein [Oceanobacillus sp. J11TS1]|uniref:SurA N-terminal domain-containing protein n=1 Tax=Oceanobacillus sp. J11TS1 TaxID=2807191 RepID=UPI001B04D4B0|nr:SurA N-terminal domain-containing protein [Oceanobacillus sp. J11TS1]GIO24548.1 hypothetical protein J11TS1_31290 [Oceanobacillus sp. J11TS1]
MKKLTLLIVMMITMFLAACGNDDKDNNEQEEGSQQEEAAQAPEPLEFSDKEFKDEDETVVVVNGEEIQGNAYNTAYSVVKSIMHQSGQDTKDTEALQQETINFLVEQELITKEAAEAGVKVDDNEVEKELNAVKETNGEEQFAKTLEDIHLTEEQFKQQLKYNITTVQYMEEAFETEVTDEEVQEMYDGLKEQAGDQEIQELDEIRDQIENMIVQQKQQEQYAAKVNELKESAEIEELV